MTNVILSDQKQVRENLLPLTFTRPVSELRQGILTIREKWQHFLPGSYSYFTAAYLQPKFPLHTAADDSSSLIIASHIIPDRPLADAISSLADQEGLYHADELLAWRGQPDLYPTQRREYNGPVRAIRHLYDIFLQNAEAIEADFEMLTSGRRSQPLSATNTVVGDPARIFIEEGASVEGAIINTRKGPVYVGQGAEIMEGACIRGALALLDHSLINMGAKVYGATTIGPHSKIGGEVNNVVITGYSNKAHDGFLGNAVIGEWCNLGAGCTASNLKNDYTEIKLWNYPAHRFLKTGLQFCGLIMGDHSKAGVNTMFNTATVVGVGVNIHGTGFPRNFVPSFSEGSAAGFSVVPQSKFFDIASRVMARRDVVLTDVDRRIYADLYQITEEYR